MKASYKIVFALALAFFVVVILVLANGDGASGEGELAAQGDAADFQQDGPDLGDDLDSSGRVPTVVIADEGGKAGTQTGTQTPRPTLGSTPEGEASRGASSEGSDKPFVKRFAASTSEASEFQGFGSNKIRRPGEASADEQTNADAGTTAGAGSDDNRVTTFGTSGRVSLGQKEPSVIEASGTASDATLGATGSTAIADGAANAAQASADTSRQTSDAESVRTPRFGSVADAGTTSGTTPGTASNTSTAAASSASLPKGVKAQYVSPVSGARKNYAIKTGDNFAVLSQRFYGSQRYWRSFSQANPKVDPTKMQVGQEIRLPDANEIKRFAPDAVEQADRKPAPVPSTTKKHIVRSGQTLSGISKQHYGSTKHWRSIYNANKKVIGSNPDRLPAGETLVIPPLVTP